MPIWTILKNRPFFLVVSICAFSLTLSAAHPAIVGTVLLPPAEWFQDSIPADSAQQQKSARPLPEPRKAMVRSLIFPGLGQIYNGHWWKTPFVYGAVGGAVYVAVSGSRNYRVFQDAYVAKLEGKPHVFSNTSLDDARRLRIQRDRYDKQRQTWYIYSVAAYGLQAVEALVDAHLQNFDVSEDLGFRIKPTFMAPPSGGMAPGIGLVWQW
jgi:hypothetical protein